MKTLVRSIALAIGMAATAGANAALLGLHSDGDTSPFVIPGNNDYAPLVGLNGTIGGHLVNTSSSSIQVTYEYLYKEAEWNNTFLVGGEAQFSTNGTPFNQTYTETVAGLAELDFAFLTGEGFLISNDSSSPSQNGVSPLQNFFLYFDEVSGAVYVALDDGAFGPDDNHDDMILRITATEVPEPAAFALLGLGLLGAGVARRRK